MLFTTAINTSNTTRTQTGVFLLVAFHCTAVICNYCFFAVVNKISIYLPVCVPVCLLVTTVSSIEMAEVIIEMPFGLWT